MHPHTHRAEIFVVLMVRQWRDNERCVVQGRDSEAGGAVHNRCRAFMRLLIAAKFTCEVTWRYKHLLMSQPQINLLFFDSFCERRLLIEKPSNATCRNSGCGTQRDKIDPIGHCWCNLPHKRSWDLSIQHLPKKERTVWHTQPGNQACPR